VWLPPLASHYQLTISYMYGASSLIPEFNSSISSVT
jgi:hypothetical protein